MRARLGLLLLLFSWPVVGLAQEDEQPDCYEVRATARYGGLGYDHLVQIENGCPRPLVCAVATNANPEPQTVRVPAGETVEVVTFRGSPAREFTPNVSCEYD